MHRLFVALFAALFLAASCGSGCATTTPASTVIVPVAGERVVALAAYLVLQSCDDRVMTPGSRLMVHEAHIEVAPADEAEAIADLEEEDTLNALLAGPQCLRLKMSEAECRQRYHNREWWLSATEAIDVGAADAWAPSVGYVVDAIRRR